MNKYDNTDYLMEISNSSYRREKGEHFVWGTLCGAGFILLLGISVFFGVNLW